MQCGLLPVDICGSYKYQKAEMSHVAAILDLFRFAVGCHDNAA